MTGEKPPSNGGDAAVSALVDAGVDVVFGIPASHVIEIYDALGREPRVRTVVGRNEQACTYMADGFARRRRAAGVAVVTGGPGLGNAVTGLQTAYADSSPVVVLASDLDPEQRAHVPLGIPHETFDSGGLALSTGATLHRADGPDEVSAHVAVAVRSAEQSRHRPSVCLLGRNALAGHVDASAFASPGGSAVDAPDVPEASSPSAELRSAARQARDLLAQAHSPLVLAGNGVYWSAAEPFLAEVLERTGLPCVTTAAARSVIDDAAPNWAGVLGNADADRLVAEADVVLAIGASFGSATTDNWRLPVPSTLIHVDTDRDEPSKHYPAALAVTADASAFLSLLLDELGQSANDSRATRASAGPRRPSGLLSHEWIDVLSAALPARCSVVGDVSTTTRWLLRSLHCTPDRRLFHPWNHQTLGWAYPAALGVQAAAPDEPVVSVIGDGGMLFCLGELATAVENDLPVCCVVVNNHSYGVIAELQDEICDGRRFGVNLRTPDFVAVARGFDMAAWAATTPAEFAVALSEALSARCPTLIEITADLAVFGD